jgi:hypothetical protein
VNTAVTGAKSRTDPMTTHPQRPDRATPTPTRVGADPRHQPDPLTRPTPTAPGDIDVVPGDPPVPLNTWRVAHPDRPDGYRLSDGLTPKLAALMVYFYARHGDTILAIGHDPALAGAAGAAGYNYLTVDDPADLADLDHVAGTVGLLVLRWPPTDPNPTSDPHRNTGDGTARPASSTETSTAALTDLFTACRILLARDGYTIVTLTPASTGENYLAYAHQLIPAARRAELGLIQHIVAITADVVEDHLDVPATPTDATTRPPEDVVVHLDLLVLVIRGGRHG